MQIVAVERCDSVSSSSTDYEEIDLSASPNVVVNEDKRTFTDSDETGSDLESDNPDSEEMFLRDSQKEEDQTFVATQEYNEKDVGEDFLEGFEDIDDDVDGNNEILSDNDADDENNIADDVDNIESNDALSDDDDHVVTDDDPVVTDDEDVENVSDEDVAEDIARNLPNNSEILEDELLDSDNEINILNDISVTIANESLPTNSAEEHMEIVRDEWQEGDLKLWLEGDSKQINNESLLASQRIIVSRSDSENENDCKFESDTKKPQEHAIKNKTHMVDKKEKKDSAVSSVSASSAISNTDLLNKTKEKSVQSVKKVTDVDIKPSPIAVKRNSQPSTVGKPELATSGTSKPRKDSTQVILPKEKAGEKAKEMGNEKEKSTVPNNNALSKVVDSGGKISSTSGKEKKVVSSKSEDEEQMDFDQLSIEDEDSDFVEEEEDLPAVKSKVGLNKIPIERSRARRDLSRENRKRRRSYSPERSRVSSRSYRNQSPSHDRLRDQRLRDRSRERLCRRSHSPSSKDRTYRGGYGRHERSRSRDRTQNRITSVVSKNRHYRSRSRSRSGSRTRSGRTEKDMKSRINVNKQVTKENAKASVKDRLDIKKVGNARPLSRSPRKEIRTQDNSDNKKTVKVKESKSATVVLVASGAKVESKPTAIKVAEIKIKQPKGLCSHML